MAKRSNNLFLKERSSIWHYAISVPPKFRPFFGGKKEIKKTTGETSKAKAEMVRAAALVAFGIQCEEAAKGPGWQDAVALGTAWSAVTPDIVTLAVWHRYQAELKDFEKYRRGGFLPKHRQTWLNHYTRKREQMTDFLLGSLPLVTWVTERGDIAYQTGVGLAWDPADDPGIMGLAQKLAETLIPLYDQFIGVLQGKISISPPRHLPRLHQNL